MVHVSALNIYPIKSCKGITLQTANLTYTGFQWDRHWVVVREDSGGFVTQRQPEGRRLAMVRVELPPAARDAAPGEPLPPGLTMCVTAPDMDPLAVSLDPLPADTKLVNTHTLPPLPPWSGAGADAGDAAAAWFSTYCGKPVRLVRYHGQQDGGNFEDDPVRRPVGQDWAPGKEIQFADQMPYHLASEESLADLNSRLPEAIPMNRFRPNIVVAGLAHAFAEDRWRSLSIGDDNVSFTGSKPCDRCPIPTIDQDTAVMDKQREPTKTLQSYRNGTQLGLAQSTGETAFKHAHFFGQLLTAQASGSVSVGDAVSVDALYGADSDGGILWEKPFADKAASGGEATVAEASTHYAWGSVGGSRSAAAIWSPEAGANAAAAAARPRRRPHALPMHGGRQLCGGGPGRATLSVQLAAATARAL